MNIKQDLYKRCLEIMNDRISEIETAISSAKDSAADDTKSSAGDKYETGREMAQQVVNRLSGQLAEAARMRQTLQTFNPQSILETAKPGALVKTDNSSFYILVALGKVSLNGLDYFVISPASPIALKMSGLAAGDRFDFNNRQYHIKSIQ